MDVKPYKREFLYHFKYDGVEKEYHGEDIIPIVEFYEKIGKCFVGFINGEIIGVGGIYPLWKDAGGCFLFLNKSASKYKKSVFKVLVQYLNIYIKEYKIKNIVVECLENCLSANNLITHLGFKKNKEYKLAMYIKGV